jgi:hypothetical protein
MATRAAEWLSNARLEIVVMKTVFFLSLSVASLVALSGCSGAPGEGASSTAEQHLSESSLRSQVVGDWLESGSDPNAPFDSLTLSDDGTYQGAKNCVSNGAFKCQSITHKSGTWIIDRTGPQLGAPLGALEIVFTDRFGKVEPLLIVLKDDTLALRTSIVGYEEFDYSKVDAGDDGSYGGNDAAGEGEACGDDVAIQKKCAPGLTCVLPTTGPVSEHTPGTCESVAGEGEACGDDVAIQKKCAPGLTCVPSTTGPVSEHTPGSCRPLEN